MGKNDEDDCCSFDQWGEVEKKHEWTAKEKKTRATAARLAEEWAQISAAVTQARTSPLPTSVNEWLLSHAKSDAKAPLTPAKLAWAADNLMMEARFEEAIEIYRDVAKRFSDHGLSKTNLWPYLFEQQAVAHERLGRIDDAVSTYESLIKANAKHPDRASWYLRLGELAESAGNDKLAAKAYANAAEDGQRAAKYLKSPGDAKATPRELANELASALRKGDADALGKLASSAYFSLAVAGSERHFVDANALLAMIAADLATSKVTIDPAVFRGCGDKLYVPTYGWQGQLCAGVVFLMLTRRRAGWQWEGIALTQLGSAFEKIIPAPEREENQRLRIRIRAPWPAGMCFRAGGIGHMVSIIAGGPLAMWIASLVDACGFGVWGFYYNQSGHSGTDAFAIDFTRNVRGVPWLDSSGGVMALSVFNGVVSLTRSFVPSGGTMTDNRVEVDHQDPLELLFALLLGRPIPVAKYRSKYLHLAGPSALMVSPLMSVVQGQRLGPMDDTGLSAVHHLHFSIHDRDLGFMSVRPTPMDGSTLNDGENGKCVCSTNVPV